MSSPEFSPEMRQQAILDSLNGLYRAAQLHLEQEGGEEYIHVGLTRYVNFSDLPQSLKQLISITEIPNHTEIRVGFGHYKAYEKFNPTYSFSIDWERSDDPDTVNNMMHLAVYEEPGEELVHGFFPSDSKTAYQSSWGHTSHYPEDYPIDLVPDHMRKAVTQKNQMQALMKNPSFQFGVVAELVSIFQNTKSTEQ